MFRVLLAILSLTLLTSCERPHGFTLKKITSKYPNDNRWNVPPLLDYEKETLTHIFDEPFTYLGSGNHCYVFGSTDGQYVLKFFKQKHMRIQSFWDNIPIAAKGIFYQSTRYRRRKKEREKSFRSYKIAFQRLKKETGIFYLHLNKTNHLKRDVTLVDQHGKNLVVDIDKMEFLIQKRAEVGYKHLSDLLKAGLKEEALESIVSLMNVVVRRMEKGIFDKDLQFFKNFGFIGNQAIELDIGEFRPDPFQRDLAHMQEEATIISTQLIEWAKCYHPEYEKEIAQTLEDLINQIPLVGR